MVDWGAGPRAGHFLIQGGKAMAAMDGRFSVAIDDIKKVAIPVLRHRISTNFQAQAEGKTSEDVDRRSCCRRSASRSRRSTRGGKKDPVSHGPMVSRLRQPDDGHARAGRPCWNTCTARRLHVRGHFRGDDHGWFRAELSMHGRRPGARRALPGQTKTASATS